MDDGWMHEGVRERVFVCGGMYVGWVGLGLMMGALRLILEECGAGVLFSLFTANGVRVCVRFARRNVKKRRSGEVLPKRGL